MFQHLQNSLCRWIHQSQLDGLLLHLFVKEAIKERNDESVSSFFFNFVINSVTDLPKQEAGSQLQR